MLLHDYNLNISVTYRKPPKARCSALQVSYIICMETILEAKTTLEIITMTITNDVFRHMNKM